MILTVDKPYDFAQSVQDYGWVDLEPNGWVGESATLRRVERLTSGKVVLIQMTANEPAVAASVPGMMEQVTLSVCVEPSSELTAAEREEVRSKVSWMLRLEDDLTPFYELAQTKPSLWAQVKSGRGRLLRSPTLFEDVVKTICTTNTTWRQTRAIVQRLVERLGSPFPGEPGLSAFPTPDQVAAAGPDFLRNEIRLGYRSQYVHQLANEVVAGQRDLALLRRNHLPSAELRKELKAIKGIGDYAANTLLMLLSHYGHLAFDTEMRTLVSQRYFDGQSPTEKEIVAVYDKWGEWRYLVYWFELLE